MIRVSFRVRSCLTLFASLIAAGLLTAQAMAVNSFLLPEPVTIRKAPVTVATAAREFFQNNPSSVAHIWVFFTDKGVFTRSQFDAAATSISLDKSAKRRAKTGMDHVVFADLPVPSTYIDQITAIGAKYRRTSLWLNAATFEITADQLDAIANLPFVAEVRLMATYKQVLPQAEEVREEPGKSTQNADALSYGGSLTQLTQISVPAVHNKGYDGSGVILAIFDTGFRKTHQAFAKHFLDGRVLAEYDFIFNDSNTSNEPIDGSAQWNHGTYTWSTSGGYKDGKLYGPAYKSSFILCKTEDTRSETQVEEDNWVAALEWVSGLGADVITSSLGYLTFDGGGGYTAADMNGATATTTLAANMCDSLGIVLCNSMGNSGPGAGTLTAPADAFNILSIGAVNSTGTLASFSSRGPTADGRMKPEVCAMGVSTYCATSASDTAYGTASGTSLSTPLVAGVACLMVQAHPDFPPSLIREAIKLTASRAATPDNDYGWGVVNANSAVAYGVSFTTDTRLGNAPLTVQFSGTSLLSPSSWSWDFGDGGTSTLQNPSHEFQNPGSYNISLTVHTASYGDLSDVRQGYILVTGDTLKFETDSVYAGQQIQISVSLHNSQDVDQIIVPFEAGKTPFTVTVDSVTRGTRTTTNWNLTLAGFDLNNKRYAYSLDPAGGGSPLPPGDGEVMRLYLKTDKYALGSLAVNVDSANVTGYIPSMHSVAAAVTYYPFEIGGAVRTKYVRRGNVDNSADFNIDVGDLTSLLGYLFLGSAAPVTIQSGDIDADLGIDVGDVTALIDYLFLGGPPPVTP